jgi:non-ribosomal peptide synthase protein (TIGR01720 family)
VDLRSYIKERLPEYMVPAAFVWLKELPLTPNGKLDRRALPVPTAETTAYPTRHVEPRNHVEEILCGIWAKLLKAERVGTNDNFFELGGDSILIIQVVGRARELGIHLTPREMFEHQTVAELGRVARPTHHVSHEAEFDTLEGPIPFTPIQQRFFESNVARPDHFNQAALFDLNQDVDSTILEQAIIALVRCHPVLRMRFNVEANAWQQWSDENLPDRIYERRDLKPVPESDRKSELEHDVSRTQASLDLQSGQLVRAVEYDLGLVVGRRLLLVIHHLVVDGVSWRILLGNLEKLYGQIKARQTIDLGVKTTSFRHWAEGIRKYSQSEEVQREVEYWCAESRKRSRPLPRDYEAADAENIVATQQTVTIELNEEETRELLQDVPEVYHTQINDVLLSALARVCGEWTKCPQVLLDIEGHGREEVLNGMDLSSTVGWFTTIWPLVLNAGSEQQWNVGDLLKTTKEQLRKVPNHGFGYGVLRYIGKDDTIRRQLAVMPQAEILFNYLGQLDQVFSNLQLFVPAKENGGTGAAEENHRGYLIIVSGMVIRNRLQVTWKYSTKLHARETIQVLADRYVCCLRSFIEHCQNNQAGGHTPSDFPLATMLRQEDLDRWIGHDKNIIDVYPLSSMQHGMLFDSLREPGTGLYTVQLSCQMDGRLIPAAFQCAWEEAVRRHSVLRTQFIWEGLIEPVQVVRERVDFCWHEEDWRDKPLSEQQEKWERFLYEDRVRGFDFFQASLLRVSLIRTGDRSYYFSWSHHHILLDGWSVQIIMREVFLLYEAYREGHDLLLNTVAPYRKHIEWLQKQNEKAVGEFWRHEMQGAAVPTRLGIEHRKTESGPSEQRYATSATALGRELTAQLESLARGQQITLNTIIRGAWGLMLARYSGKSDIVFGEVVSGRSADIPFVEDTVGLFINTIPVRVRIRPDETVASYLRRLHAQKAAAQDYEYASLVRVRAWSKCPVDAALFESVVVFENYPVDVRMQEQIVAGMQISSLKGFDVNSMPLSLIVNARHEILLKLLYDSRVFKREDIDRLLNHFSATLGSMATGMNCRVLQLSLVGDKERQLLVGGWSGLPVIPAVVRTICTVLQQHAETQPHALALISDGEVLTFSTLSLQVNQIARLLRTYEIQPGDRVLVCLKHCTDVLIAVLGIIKIGAIFVVLDPDASASHSDHVVKDAGVALVLGEKRTVDKLGPEGSQLTFVAINRDCSTGESCESLGNSDPGDVAGILYRSSQTGMPEGVLVPHGALLLENIESMWGITSEDRVVQHLDFSADVSCLQVFATLAAGACLVNISEFALPPRKLAMALRDCGANVLFVSAATLVTLVQEFPWALHSVKAFFCDDPIKALRRFAEKVDKDILEKAHGVYSLCEAGGVTFRYELARLRKGLNAVSLESVAPGTTIYVLDAQMEAAPDDVMGELYIGGSSLAIGYQRQAIRTAETFVPDPFSSVVGARLLRTGDFARRRPGGALEFQGRRDGRLWVHHIRVHPQEIEAILLRQPAVREAAVALREMSEAGPMLVAFVILVEGETVSLDTLHELFQNQLPRAMRPLEITVVSAIPKTIDGTVDRDQLALIAEDGNVGAVPDFAPPRSDIEQRLTQIWIEVLRSGNIGIHDNFFRHGGQSLLATQLVGRVSDAFRVNINLQQLFSTPTIAGLAKLLEDTVREVGGGGTTSQMIPEIKPVARRGTKAPTGNSH